MVYKGIQAVDFGQIAAEDDCVQEYFLETPEYWAIANQGENERGPQKILVIGRKGSGKSAIYLALRDILAKQDENVVVTSASLQEYPWDKHQEIKDTGMAPRLAYITSWKFIFYVLLAQLITNYYSQRQFSDRAQHTKHNVLDIDRRYVHRFLDENLAHINLDVAEVLFDAVQRVNSLTMLD